MAMMRTCARLRQDIESYRYDPRTLWIFYHTQQEKGNTSIDNLTYPELRSIWIKILRQVGLPSKQMDSKRLITSAILLMHNIGIDEWTVDDLLDAMKSISYRTSIRVPFRKQVKYIMLSIPIAVFDRTEVTTDSRQKVHFFRYVGE